MYTVMYAPRKFNVFNVKAQEIFHFLISLSLGLIRIDVRGVEDKDKKLRRKFNIKFVTDTGEERNQLK